MARPIQASREALRAKIAARKQANKTASAEKWTRLRQVAAEESKEVDSALNEVAHAFGTMADAIINFKENLDLVEAPKSATLKTRLASAKKYASTFRRMAEESPEVIADAITEVYHSLDDVAGALENLATNMGIDLNLTPVEQAFAEEGQKEEEGEIPEEETEESSVDEPAFEEAEKEIETPEGEEAVEEVEESGDEEGEVKEAAGSDWFVSDRDEAGEPKAPVIASGEFVNDRDEQGKPKSPDKLSIPMAQGDSEVNKAASARLKEAMTKKDFIMIADAIRSFEVDEETKKNLAKHISGFLRMSNPRFMESRFIGYVMGTNGPSGGSVKEPKVPNDVHAEGIHEASAPKSASREAMRARIARRIKTN